MTSIPKNSESGAPKLEEVGDYVGTMVDPLRKAPAANPISWISC